jgi:muconate cycloisomerase
MKIKSFELYEISIPTRRKHTWATSTIDVGMGYTILRLVSDDGIEGYGEATAMAEWGGDFDRYYGETAATTRVVIERNLFPAVEGMEVFDIDLIHRKMDLAIRGYPYAKTAIDEAVYDLMGKATGLPIYRLLGGRNRKKIPIAHSLGGAMEIDIAVSEAVEAVHEGIKTIKIKGGIDVRRDLALMKKLRGELGPDIAILLDANQSYPSSKEAIKWGNLLDQYDLEYLEQPVQGLEQMRQVTHGVSCPVCADESCWSVSDAIDIISKKAADYISIYTTKPGGLYHARAIARVAEAAGVRCNVNGSGEFGVGNAANLHLASTGRNINLASVFPVTHLDGRTQTEIAGRWYQDDIITKPFEYDDGCLLVPDDPGLGVEIDWAKMKKYAVEQHEYLKE